VDYYMRLPTFEALARLAWLNTDSAVNQVSPPATTWRRRPEPWERWICYAFRQLHRVGRLSTTVLNLLSGARKLLWFDGDAFAASVAAIDFAKLATGDDQERRSQPFIPTKFQQCLLKELEGKALRGSELERKLRCDRKRLYRDGIDPLREEGRVANHRRVGYYRPDHPPAQFAETLSRH
jgi:hypothetical protein